MERVTRILRSERTADLLLWLMITAQVPVGGDDPDPPGLPLGWVRAAAPPLLGLAVLVARRRPVVAAAVPLALGLAASPELYTSNFNVAQVVLAYLLGRRSAGQRAALQLFGAACAVGLLTMTVLPGTTTSDALTLVGNVLLTAVLPWLAGRFMRQRAELVRTGWQLAERLEREQQLVGDRERLRERSRIARDMHDSLGHDLSLIALRAGVLQVAPGLGEEGRRAAGDLRQAAAAATERLREVIGVLREESEGAPVLPAGDTVESLVERAAASGMAVTLIDALGPPGDRTPDGAGLPPMTDRAVYRVVQEALTNATKHAPGAPVTVALRCDGQDAVVTVANDAPPGTPPAASGEPARGYGLVGLDERVRLAGGTLRARPRAGGFAVTARLPLAPGTGATPPGDEDAEPRDVALVRRRARRGMIGAIWAPVAVALVLLLIIIGDILYTSYNSVLREDVYEELRIGQRRSAVEDRLPAYQAGGDARPEYAPADPPGTDECRFYRVSTFPETPVYRVCFTGGRLSHKNEIDVGR